MSAYRVGASRERVLPVVLILVLAGCDELDHRLDQDCDPTWVPDVSCPYPEGPYAANHAGDVPGPAFWPCSIRASQETDPLEHASLEVFHCDPGVKSVVIFFAAAADEDTPEWIAEFVGMRDRLEELGSRWVWLLVGDTSSGASTTPEARSYFEGHGVTFGWFTSDSDDSWDGYAFHNNVPGGEVPSVLVIDAGSMQIVDHGFDPEMIAWDLEMLADR